MTPMSEELLCVLEPKSAKGKAAKVALPKGLDQAKVQRMYRLMVQTRQLDDRAMKLQRQGRIGFYVPSIGQEACAVGSAFALSDKDWCYPSYREPGAALAVGVSIQAMIHQLYGNAEDVTKGRQMPVHYAFRKQRYVSVSSPIGTQIVQAVGTAMAQRIRKEKAISITYFGDGATSSNDFHTGLNFAAVYKAPTIFLCSNNQWAISCPLGQQTASDTIAVKAKAYGMPGVRVDGNDVFAVVAVTRQAVARAASGGGSTLIEALTYRMGGHSTSDDPTRYRAKGEVEPWISRDPIERLRHFLTINGGWSDADEEALRSDTDARVRDAIAAAERTGAPALETMFEDVYQTPPWHLAEQRDALLAGPRAPAAH